MLTTVVSRALNVGMSRCDVRHSSKGNDPMPSTRGHRPARLTVLAAVAVAGTLAVGGCAKSSDSGSSSGGSTSGSSKGGQQQVSSAGSKGPACTFTKYGVPKVDLTKVTVGFSQ